MFRITVISLLKADKLQISFFYNYLKLDHRWIISVLGIVVETRNFILSYTSLTNEIKKSILIIFLLKKYRWNMV